MSEINMIKTRPKRIKLKPLRNKYKDNYSHHMLKFDTAWKLDIIHAADVHYSTVSYYLVKLVARILLNYLLFLNPRVAMSEIQRKRKKIIWFSQQYQFHNIRNMHIWCYMRHKKSESYSRPQGSSKTEKPTGKETMDCRLGQVTAILVRVSTLDTQYGPENTFTKPSNE